MKMSILPKACIFIAILVFKNNNLKLINMYQRQVSFGEAISRGFGNYVNFSGRASRSEYWWWALFNFLVSFCAGIIDGLFQIEFFTYIALAALLLPGIAVAVRRLHDIGKSGWWLFLALIPLVGSIILLVWYCQDSQMYANEYGYVPNMTD